MSSHDIFDVHFKPEDVIDDKFRLARRLGAGGMSSVWYAWDLVLDRAVALKLLSRTLVADPTWRDRFTVEARHMARVRHENVVPVHSFGMHQGWPYFVMDHIEGITLTDWRRVRPKPSVGEIVSLVKQIASGLDAIHAAGLVHRDVKPSNVLIDRAGHVTLLDLGLSALVAKMSAAEDGSGTPSYMAPEQTQSARLSPELARRTDIYQLGVTTFELLVGEVPFDDDGAASIFERHRNELPRPPSSTRPDLVPAVDRAVLTALAKDPLDRYPSASAFADALSAATHCASSAASPARRPLRVLVAEDEPSELTATCAILSTGLPPGSEVRAASDGATALELAAREEFDALVLDLHMPGLSGLEVVERLEEARKRKPYIVVMTALGGADDWRALRAHGVNAILLKPFDGEDLVSMIERHRSVGAAPASAPGSLSGPRRIE